MLPPILTRAFLRRLSHARIERSLAGEYEKRVYALERSPARDVLLDTLEIAAARARAGEETFIFDDLDGVEEWDEEEDEEP